MVGVFSYGALVGVGFRIKLSNALPLLAAAVVLIEGSWITMSLVAGGWAVGHALHLLQPLIAAREAFPTTEGEMMTRFRVAAAVALAACIIVAIAGE